MKFIIAILNVYLLLLTFLPCNDGNCVQDYDTIEVISAFTSHHSDTDDCTPFCSCSCCQVLVVNTDIQALEVAAIAHRAIHNTAHRSSYSKETSYDFWQPPRLG